MVKTSHELPVNMLSRSYDINDYLELLQELERRDEEKNSD